MANIEKAFLTNVVGTHALSGINLEIHHFGSMFKGILS